MAYIPKERNKNIVNQFQIIQFLAQHIIQDYTNHHGSIQYNNDANNTNHQHDMERYQILLDAFEDKKASILKECDARLYVSVGYM